MNMKHTFIQIYKNKTWFEGSGSGSFPENTEQYRALLQQYISKYGVKSVIDIGCGDWKFSKLMDWSGITYLGLDVVDDVMQSNRETYQTDTIKSVYLNERCSSIAS